MFLDSIIDGTCYIPEDLSFKVYPPVGLNKGKENYLKEQFIAIRGKIFIVDNNGRVLPVSFIPHRWLYTTSESMGNYNALCVKTNLMIMYAS